MVCSSYTADGNRSTWRTEVRRSPTTRILDDVSRGNRICLVQAFLDFEHVSFYPLYKLAVLSAMNDGNEQTTHSLEPMLADPVRDPLQTSRMLRPKRSMRFRRYQSTLSMHAARASITA